jgi:arylsulfatase
VENNFDYSDLYEGKHWFEIPGKEALVHASDQAVTSAIRFLRKRPKHKNFALTVAFYPPKAVGNSDVPGAQWSPKNESMGLYQNDTIPEPEMNDSWKKLPYFFRAEMPARSRWGERFNGTERYQASMKNYYRMITEVDSACETIFNALSKQGILNQTMVIFTADNGFFHGEHGLGKNIQICEISLRWTLVRTNTATP